MNKNLFILLSIAPLLASCGESQWSWWEDDNTEITKFISLSDAQKAVDSSATNSGLASIRTKKETYKTYYKDYLGNFSTETDSNISSSSVETATKYSNDVIVTNLVSTSETNFLNAKSVNSKQVDTYLVAQADKSFTEKTITDYGYGKKIGSEKTSPYIDDDNYNETLRLGSKMNSASITWVDNATTYGFSKNDDVIVETMSSASGIYTVKFNGKSLTTFVTNTYTLYRFKPLDKGNADTTYMLDYTYSKIEILIGSSIFDEPLDEPFLLEKRESSITYENKENSAYDINQIPSIDSL